MIRVGRCIYTSDGIINPKYDNFTPIVVMSMNNKWGTLSPYHLTDDKGRIFEDLWQFSKIYKEVPKVIQRKSKYDSTIIWDHPAEVHLTDAGQITEEYVKWRYKGMYCKYPIRYPVGYHHRHKCLYAIPEDENGFLTNDKYDYITSRKEIYLKEYYKLVKRVPQYTQLKQRLANGENLLIIEVDGPHQESLPYYKEKYEVVDDFIINNTMLATDSNLQIMLNDPKHPFGHGYCLAVSLLH